MSREIFDYATYTHRFLAEGVNHAFRAGARALAQQHIASGLVWAPK